MAAADHYAFVERTLRRHTVCGSGVVSVYGPAACGKTTSLLRVLQTAASKRRRPEASGLAAASASPEAMVAYVSIDTVRDWRGLHSRVIEALTGSDAAPSAATATAAGVAGAIRVASASNKAVHVVLDHCDSPLAGAVMAFAELGAQVSTWFAGAGSCANVTFWVVARQRIELGHALRHAAIPALPTAVLVAHVAETQLARDSFPGSAMAKIGQFITTQRPMRDSASVAEFGRAVRVAEAMLSTEQLRAAASAMTSSSTSAPVKEMVAAFSVALERNPFDSAATVEVPVVVRLLAVACYMCGAMTPAQTAAVFSASAGSLMAPATRRRQAAAAAAVARAESPHSISIGRLSFVYDSIVVIYESGKGSRQTEAADDELPPPPAAAALHHLGALESRGYIRRAAHNHGLYKCTLSFEDCRGIADTLGIDAGRLVPSS